MGDLVQKVSDRYPLHWLVWENQPKILEKELEANANVVDLCQITTYGAGWNISNKIVALHFFSIDTGMCHECWVKVGLL